MSDQFFGGREGHFLEIDRVNEVEKITMSRRKTGGREGTRRGWSESNH